MKSFFRLRGKPAEEESSLVADIKQVQIPRHIAIIMDGNGRWASSKGLPRIEGHRSGAKTVRMVVEECRRLGVRYLTLYCFSSENWQRPRAEVEELMRLFVQHLKGEAVRLRENGVRLRAIGDLGRLPADVLGSLNEAAESTALAKELDLILAISYGGRDELVAAMKGIAAKVSAGALEVENISAATISENLYAPDVPDPELMIRTSGECRVSNFLLWQIAYSELVISNLCWPEFSKAELHRSLLEYGKRKRRFGKTDQQLIEGRG